MEGWDVFANLWKTKKKKKTSEQGVFDVKEIPECVR